MKCSRHGIKFRSVCPSCELDEYRQASRPAPLPKVNRFTARVCHLRDGRVWWQVLEEGKPFPVGEGDEPDYESAVAEAELRIEQFTNADPVTEWEQIL